ncbi:GNAT family N-acetyltransferase [Marinicellulosiphila megalodicopiae]|uniref:GNAT family N-acetyltransferase n=1 Tax=Marinicellulosiphila megalodicopiae TaxID=2724896 RepID=UPI003BB01912
MATDKITIRQATINDFDVLEAINQTSSTTPYQTFALKNAINQQCCFCVTLDDHTIIAWMAIQKGFELIDILYITTANDFKRKGLSRKLFQYIRTHYPNYEIMLEVRKSNTSAIQLYESLGMTFLNERKNYYINPNENALVYKYFL